ncbi:MAG TPA: amino acid adenylation domain-containing protein [Pseudonocardiaceae bacterium]|nr:amino acid adenylation domain-containing protein [Pseudonocardiaceae bacterium]
MTTIVALLQQRARQQPAGRAFVFVDDPSGDHPDREHAVSYAELDAAARRVAAAVSARAAPGQPVLLLYPPGRGYVEGFLGCLYAGVIAVPAYPPDPARLARTLPRLRGLIADCGAGLALGESWLIDAARQAAQAPELAALDWIATDRLAGDSSWTPPRLDAGSPALLQYTSGSTGAPKGVLLNHANLMHNVELVRLGFGTSPGEVGLSWLPPYHDMGLIGGILQPIYAGMPTVLMSPLAFLQRPLGWLEAISRLGVTMSGGPNFAFDLCVRKSTEQQRAALDLSRWKLAFCGAEPVRAATLERFAEAFAGSGFRREAFYPCYGLAEATLIVSGGPRDAAPRLVRHADTVHVGCGTALGDQRIVIVDPATGATRPPGAEGEIWVAGPSVAQGYWRRPEETAATFRARLAGDPRHYLRTGDLGVLSAGGELAVTGRIKDLMVIRGRNVYPQDLEHAIEEHVAEVRAGCSAAFPVEAGGEERVAIACEVAGDGPAGETVAAIRQVLAENAEVSPAAVVLLRPRTIPKTSSGKIQRHACRRAFLAGDLSPGEADVLARWDEDGGTVEDRPRDEDRPPGEGPSLTAAVAQVLGLPAAEIDPDAPLTRLGLDSLRAVELRHALDEHLGLDVSLSELLAGATVTELAARPARAPAPATPAAVSAGPTVSIGQRALWFLQRWAPDSTAYQISRAARIRTPLDAEALERALGTLVRRHPALHLRLPSEGGEPVPRTFDWAGPVLERHDVAALDDDALRQRVQADALRRFDLERGPLLRLSLYSRGHADQVLLLSVHHVVADFWSLSVLVDELLTLYRGELAGVAAPLPELAPASAPPAAGPDQAARLDYWRATLADAPAALELPTTFPRPKVQSFQGATHAFRMDPAVLRALDSLADEAGVTRFVTLLAGFAALLARYTGEDVVIGTPIAGREDRSTGHTIGYLVNAVPLRIVVEPGTPFRALLARVRQVLLDALDNAVPFSQLVEAVRPPRDPSRPPVMQVALQLQQAPPGRPDLAPFGVADETARVRIGDLDVAPYRLADQGAAFDLSLTLAEVAGGLTGSLEYCADLFDEPAVARLTRQLTTLLAQAGRAPDIPVDALEIMDCTERAAVLALAGGGPSAVTPAVPLQVLFGRQATRRPEATAVVCGNRELSYRELDDRTDRLAAVLRDKYGLRRSGIVAGYLPRHEDAIVAFWAVLKAGGGYLALEPTLPVRRVQWMISDARPAVLLTHSELSDRLPSSQDHEPPRLFLDQPWPAAAAAVTPAEVGPDDLAYVMYTSGSTGRPKGVLVPHRGGPNVACTEAALVGLTEHDRVLQYASCAFDVSVDEILVAHLHGAALVITPPSATVPGPELVRLLEDQRITKLFLSPSALAALPDAELPHLARLASGGEAITAELLAKWAPGRRFVNVYGPTEATISAAIAVLKPDGMRPPIGPPIPGAFTYVLDPQQRPVPVGVPGELYIGGDGVAWGYVDRPDLTAELFVPDPFGPVPGKRLYRTGDRVRWLPDGSLDYLGRLDDQVKIRGTRVEPGEVEDRLRELVGTGEVAVVPRHSPAGGIELVAYLATQQRQAIAELRAKLRAELPEPWVPAAFVYLDSLPLTTSHKLNRRALPAPTPADRGVTARTAPRTDLERLVARVWADVLGVPEVGLRDHFFAELAGSSLLVVRVTSKLTDELGVEVPITHVFEHPTVEALAHRLAGTERPSNHRRPEDRAAARRAAMARRAGGSDQGHNG